MAPAQVIEPKDLPPEVGVAAGSLAAPTAMVPEGLHMALAATPVIARVKVGNGRFDAKVVGRKDSLEASAIWKVVVLSGEQEPISEAVGPAEYGDLEKTPLKLQLNSVFLEIRIRKPVK